MPDPLPSSAFGRARRAAYEAPAYGPLPHSRSRFLLVGLPLFAVFAAFGAIVWLAYVEAAPGSAYGEPPLIRAEAAPIKIRPDDPGGRVVADQGELRELIGDQEMAGQLERLLPLPEEPVTPAEPAPAEQPAEAPPSEQMARSQDDAADADDELATAPEPTTGEGEQPAGEVMAQAPSPGSQTEAEATAALDALLAEVGGQPSEPARDRAGASEPALSEPEPAAESARVVVPSPGRPAQPEQVAPAPPAVEQPEPAPEPRELAALDPEQTTPPPPQQSEPVRVVAAPDQQSAAGAAPSYRIQLAAVRDEADARRAWGFFQDSMADALSGLDPIIERANTANGIFYRVQVGPFTDLAGAESLCENLKQRNASCFVIRR